MTRIGRRHSGLHRDQRGQATVEYVLLLAVFGIPMMWVFATLLALMSEYYGMITFMETLPIP
jgi:Flp pilus assembly pilin Flp